MVERKLTGRPLRFARLGNAACDCGYYVDLYRCTFSGSICPA